MSSTPKTTELRDKCASMQAAIGLDDIAWKEYYGNEQGLYGFIAQQSQEAVLGAIHKKIVHIVESNHHDPEAIAAEVFYDYEAIRQSQAQLDNISANKEKL